MLRLLINRQDVSPNALCWDKTPLQYAVEANREDMVELLLRDKRVNPDFTLSENGETPLLQALIKNNEKMAKALLDAGANPNIASGTWLTPAMLLEAPDAEARQVLLERYSVSRE